MIKNGDEILIFYLSISANYDLWRQSQIRTYIGANINAWHTHTVSCSLALEFVRVFCQFDALWYFISFHLLYYA